jgi:hypothetical protein
MFTFHARIIDKARPVGKQYQHKHYSSNGTMALSKNNIQKHLCPNVKNQVSVQQRNIKHFQAKA